MSVDNWGVHLEAEAKYIESIDDDPPPLHNEIDLVKIGWQMRLDRGFTEMPRCIKTVHPMMGEERTNQLRGEFALFVSSRAAEAPTLDCPKMTTVLPSEGSEKDQ